MEEKARRLDPDQRVHAEQIVKTQLFRTWVVSPTSAKLLVHGNFSGTKYTSALSLFCGTLTETLRAKEGFYSLIFFCGLHLHLKDEEDTEPHIGTVAMIKSLIAQLLHQHRFDTSTLPHDSNPLYFHDTNIGQLCALFGWLVHQLPEDITLFCLIDGIEYFERDKFINDMPTVLAYILELTMDSTITAIFKVLVTSPWRTEFVRRPFENEGRHDEILSLASMSSMGGTPSMARLQRRLYEGLGGSAG